MRIIEVEQSPSGQQRWDAYTYQRTGTIFDLFCWRQILWDAYQIPSYFFICVDGEEPCGALSLYEIKHPIFGHYLATAPFGTDGGLIVDDQRALPALIEAAKKLADQKNASYLVIRSRTHNLSDYGFTVDRRFATFTIDLKQGLEILRKQIGDKTRNQIRKGEKEGFTITSGSQEIRPFFDVVHRHMRHLGSPAHNERFFEAIARHCSDKAEFLTVRDKEGIAGAALLFTVNNTAANVVTVTLKNYNPRCPNYLLYWHMIKKSAEQGCATFDMGRSLLESTGKSFKENWSPQTVNLNYNYYLRKLKTPPFMDPRNPKYAAAIAAWRLMPLAVTKFLGPKLIRGIA